MIEPSGIDIAVFSALNFDGGTITDWIMYLASGRLTWVPFYVFLLWVVYRGFGIRAAITFLVVCALMITCADQTASLCKTYLPKYRPTHYEALAGHVHTVNGYEGGLYGTVSSHAANAMALMMLAGLTISRRWLWWTMGAWVALMSYSRIYLGVHYPMDILLGLVEGAFWGIVWWLILRKLLSLRFITK